MQRFKVGKRRPTWQKCICKCRSKEIREENVPIVQVRDGVLDPENATRDRKAWTDTGTCFGGIAIGWYVKAERKG